MRPSAGRRAAVRSVPVAYDVELADRMRELLAGRRGITEQRMFGGLAFLVDGNLAIAASSQGGVLVRADPAKKADRLVATTAAEAAVMRGRPMTGWLRVAADQLRTKRQLERWVKIGTEYAASLPRKPRRSR